MQLECGGCGGPIVEGSKLTCPMCQMFMRMAAGKIMAFVTIMRNAADVMVENSKDPIILQHASILAEAAMIAMDITKRNAAEVQPKIIS